MSRGTCMQRLNVRPLCRQVGSVVRTVVAAGVLSWLAEGGRDSIVPEGYQQDLRPTALSTCFHPSLHTLIASLFIFRFLFRTQSLFFVCCY